MRKNVTASAVELTDEGRRLSAGTILSTTLPGGLRLISNQVPYVHSITLGIWVNAGSREDPEGAEGLAHFIEHALFKGTLRRDYVEIARCIEEAGGYIDAWTTKEQTCFYVRCLREHLRLGFDLLADLICNPVFPTVELEKEKAVVIEEIAGINDTPEELIAEEFDLLAFPGHPLGTPILGSVESVTGISESGLRSFMKHHYVPEKMLVTAVGNIDHEELESLAKEYFDGLTPAPQDTPPRKLFDITAYRPFRKTRKMSLCQAQILLGTVAPREDRLYWPLMVLNSMLSNGMSSILNLELRERQGLVYQTYSSIAFLDEITNFNIYAATDSSKISRALETITALFTGQLLSDPDPAEIETAKAKMLGSLIMGMEKMTRRMSGFAQDLFYTGQYLTPTEKASLIEAVTPADVAEAALSLGIPSKLSTLIYRPSR